MSVSGTACLYLSSGEISRVRAKPKGSDGNLIIYGTVTIEIYKHGVLFYTGTNATASPATRIDYSLGTGEFDVVLNSADFDDFISYTFRIFGDNGEPEVIAKGSIKYEAI